MRIALLHDALDVHYLSLQCVYAFAMAWLTAQDALNILDAVVHGLHHRLVRLEVALDLLLGVVDVTKDLAGIPRVLAARPC